MPRVDMTPPSTILHDYHHLHRLITTNTTPHHQTPNHLPITAFLPAFHTVAAC